MDTDDVTAAAPMAAADEPIPEEQTFTFRKPIVFGGETYTDMTLREPTAGQWAEWDKLDGVDANIRAISLVSGKPEQVIRLLGTRDFNQAMAYINRFFA